MTAAVTTLAGNTTGVGAESGGNVGFVDGTGTAAAFNLPHGVALDAAGGVAIIVRERAVGRAGPTDRVPCISAAYRRRTR